MRRLTLLLAVLAVGALVLATPTASRPAQDDLTPPELLEPASGQRFTVGTQIVFRIRANEQEQYLWLHVSSSPTPVDACGTIGYDADLESFSPTSDPTVYEAHSSTYGVWVNTPGTYYWQAYRIKFGNGADGCIESEVRALTIEAAPKPSPTPKPTPKAPGLLSQARIAGKFEIVERITSVSGIDREIGGTDDFTWSFAPQCGAGPCSVRMTFTFVHPSHPFSGSHVAKVVLKRNGVNYNGASTGAFAECSGKDVIGTIALQLRVTAGAWIDGKWRATRVTGSSRYAIPTATVFAGQSVRCPAARYTAAIRGSLKQ